jgi:uncharacterized membrane protein YeiH
MFEIAEFIGTIAFSMSGFFVGVRAKLDLLGVLVATFLTALGGGIIRDIAVHKTPYTFTHNYPALIVLAVLIILILFKFHRKDSIENKMLFILSDSIGLISFSITGSLIALENNLNLTGVLALSFVTAVGGGIARDVIINEVPFVLKTGFYGTISLLIALSMYFLNTTKLISIYSIFALFIIAIILRLIAYYHKWSIPLK